MALVACLPAANAASFSSASAVPPGFESLVKGQDLLLEITLLGRSLGFFTAYVTPVDLSFRDPGKLLAALDLASDLSQSVRDTLRARLGARLRNNSERACSSSTAAPNMCGYLKTDTVEIIFDETNQVVELFLNSNWLATSLTPKSGLINPSPGVSTAFIQRQVLNVVASKQVRSMSASATAALGMTPDSYLASDYAVLHNESYGTSATSFELNSLYYHHDWRQRYYTQFGRMNWAPLSGPLGGSFDFSLLPLDRVDGVRVGTTQAYMDNTIISSERTPVTILLSHPARVDAYRGKQLLSTSYLSSGVHQLESSAFPPGSYPLTLRIIENGVLVRTESEPFSRVDNGAGAAGNVQWFFQAGQPRDRQNNTMSVLGGVKLALNQRLGVAVGVVARDSKLYAESYLRGQHDDVDLGSLTGKVDMFVGNDSSRGNVEQLTWYRGVALSLYRTSVTTPQCLTDSLMNCYQSFSGSLSSNLFDWVLSGSYTASRSQLAYLSPYLGLPNQPWATWGELTQTPALGYDPASQVSGATQLIQSSIKSQSLRIDAGRNFLWHGVNIGTQLSVYRNQTNGHQNTGVQVSLTFSLVRPSIEPGSTSFQQSAEVSTQRSAYGSSTRYTGSVIYSRHDDTYRELDIKASGINNNVFEGAIGGHYESNLGNLSGNLSDSFEAASGRHFPALSASYASSFSLTPHGMYWSRDIGSGVPLAGVVVDLEKDDDSAPVSMTKQGKPIAEILSGGKKYAFSSDSVFIPVQGFSSNTVDIRDTPNVRSDGVVTVTRGVGGHDWFILPGHLGINKLAVSVSYTYVGRLTDDVGRPLSQALILDADLPQLNDDGSMVGEFHFKPRLLHALKGASVYRCVLPAFVPGAPIQNAGTVRCQTMALAGLPASLKKRPVVVSLLETQGAPASRVDAGRQE